MIGALEALGLRVDGPADELSGQRDDRPARPMPASTAAWPARCCGSFRHWPPSACAPSRSTATSRPAVRPIAPLLDALRGLGVDIDGDGLPFRVRGAGAVAGGAVDIDASASSQFVSGLLLAGPSFTDGLTVQHIGPSLPSAPHIAMTVAMLRQAGVDVDDATPTAGRCDRARSPRAHWHIEPDLSNAVPFIAAAVVSGGTVRITGWPAASIQPADTILSILAQLNCVVRQH